MNVQPRAVAAGRHPVAPAPRPAPRSSSSKALAHNAHAIAQHRLQPGRQRASSISTGASGWRRASSSSAPGPRAGGDLVRRQAGGQPRPLAALRGAGDADRHDVALAQARATLAVRQEALGAVQRHEAACHGGHPGNHPATMQIADPVRRAWPPDRIVQQRVITQHGDAHLARAGGGQDAQRHGSGQPSPRSSCAVSNSGRPTTLE